MSVVAEMVVNFRRIPGISDVQFYVVKRHVIVPLYLTLWVSTSRLWHLGGFIFYKNLSLGDLLWDLASCLELQRAVTVHIFHQCQELPLVSSFCCTCSEWGTNVVFNIPFLHLCSVLCFLWFYEPVLEGKKTFKIFFQGNIPKLFALNLTPYIFLFSPTSTFQ